MAEAAGTLAARVCSVEGCGRPHRAKGLCGRHYERTRPPRPDRHLHRGPGVDRTARVGLVDLTHRLLDLAVCESVEEAAHLVVLIDACWTPVGVLALPSFVEPSFATSSFVAAA